MLDDDHVVDDDNCYWWYAQMMMLIDFLYIYCETPTVTKNFINSRFASRLPLGEQMRKKQFIIVWDSSFVLNSHWFHSRTVTIVILRYFCLYDTFRPVMFHCFHSRTAAKSNAKKKFHESFGFVRLMFQGNVQFSG